MSINNDYEEELEILQSIYGSNLIVNKLNNGTVLNIALPIQDVSATCCEVSYVQLNLKIFLSPNYPSVPATVSIVQPRGLSESQVDGLNKILASETESQIGDPVVYNVIEIVKNYLEENNVPVGECAICLEDLDKKDGVWLTDCLHYFHGKCLYSYVSVSQTATQADSGDEMAEPVGCCCPVCRETLEGHFLESLISEFREISDSSEDGSCNELVIPDEIAGFRDKMADKWAYQMAKGGIIDVDKQRNKFLITRATPVPDNVVIVSRSSSREECESLEGGDSAANGGVLEDCPIECAGKFTARKSRRSNGVKSGLNEGKSIPREGTIISNESIRHCDNSWRHRRQRHHHNNSQRKESYEWFPSNFVDVESPVSHPLMGGRSYGVSPPDAFRHVETGLQPRSERDGYRRGGHPRDPAPPRWGPPNASLRGSRRHWNPGHSRPCRPQSDLPTNDDNNNADRPWDRYCGDGAVSGVRNGETSGYGGGKSQTSSNSRYNARRYYGRGCRLDRHSSADIGDLPQGMEFHNREFSYNKGKRFNGINQHPIK